MINTHEPPTPQGGIGKRTNPYNPKELIKGPIQHKTLLEKHMVIYSLCDEEGHCDRSGHPRIRCIEESQGVICNRNWEYRHGREPYKHDCPIPPKNFSLPLTDTGSTNVMARIRRRFHIFLATASLSYKAATSDEWYAFLYLILAEFRNSGIKKPEEWYPRISRKQLSVQVNEGGKICKEEFLRSLRGFHVSFSVDAYTLYHRHQIAAMLCAPHLGIKPRLVYLRQDSNEIESYVKVGVFLEYLCRLMFLIIIFLITSQGIRNDWNGNKLRRVSVTNHCTFTGGF
jgi:hypothetical protein